MSQTFEAWERSLPAAVTADPSWRIDALRLAMWLGAMAIEDVKLIRRTPGCTRIAEQLVSAVGSIAANISEGLGRPTVPDRLKFAGYALGSTREAITWYTLVRASLPPATFEGRVDALARIRQMLMATIRRQRTRLNVK